jgi:hypothetical protein
MLLTKQIFHMSATTLAALLLGCICASGQDVPPPPKLKDDGPSLADTMKFIKERLNSIGPVNHVAYGHDNIGGSDAVNKFSIQATNVRANVAACRMDYHWHVTRDDQVHQVHQVLQDRDFWFSLKDVEELTVKTREQELKELGTQAGLPELTVRVDPPVFVLSIKRTEGPTNLFYLFDEALANRIAKAMVHAVELCGGGNKEPF